MKGRIRSSPEAFQIDSAGIVRRLFVRAVWVGSLDQQDRSLPQSIGVLTQAPRQFFDERHALQFIAMQAGHHGDVPGAVA